MAWQGTPFLFDQGLSTSDLVIALSRMPKIIVDSPPDYTNLVVTALVSLVAGLFPALIAVWTFKRNADNVRTEREIQQEFLREERRNQQMSFEEDRKTQIIIAERNFNMQVLSGNRQSWINALRDIVADYMVEAPALVDATNSYRLQTEHVRKFHKILEQKKLEDQSDYFRVEHDKALQELSSSSKKMDEKNEKVSLLSSKILMMLNPAEDEYQKIKSLFGRVRVINSVVVKPDFDNDKFGREYAEVLDITNNLLIYAQSIFKREWERVKAGI